MPDRNPERNSLVNPLAFLAMIRGELEKIINNELPESVWREVDQFFDVLAEDYRQRDDDA